MKRQIIITVAVAALFAAPMASADWFAYGTYEPDTVFDEDGGFMRDAHNVDNTKKQLYFNVYQTSWLAGTSMNSATLGSRIQQPGLQNFNAILGEWVDCNGDSYVGFEESALVVYPASLLTDDSVCKASDDIFDTHNDGQWVYEYIPVGYQHTGCGGTCEDVPNVNQVIIEDKDALVWGDIGLPGAQGAQTCPISPFPHGTTAGSGWLLRYVDCFIANRIQQNVNEVDSDGSLGLRFDNVGNPQQSDSLLNQHFPESLFGNPETGETGTMQLDSDEDKPGDTTHEDREYAFTTWDCSSRAAAVQDPLNVEQNVAIVTVGTRRVIVDDPTFDGEEGAISGNYGKEDQNFTDDDGNYAVFARPAPAPGDPTGSFADGLNQTFQGFRVGGDSFDYDTQVGGDCDFESTRSDGDNTYSNVHQTAFFRADAPFEPGAAAKKETDDYFYFYNGCEHEGATAEALGPNAPNSHVSTPPTQFIGGANCADPIWQSNTLWATTPQSINRNTLQPNPAAYWTFYARVGGTTTSAGYTTTGKTGTYGSEACGSFTTGVHKGWDCDPSHWYTDANYVPVDDQGTPWQGKVGYTYQFRDIDCFDGTVARGSGVRASLLDAGPAFDPDRDWRPCQDA